MTLLGFPIAVWLLAAQAAGPEVGLPDDARIASVRAELQATVDRVRADGLPAELVIGKVREGLAKDVAPDLIAKVTSELATRLAGANRFARSVRSSPPSVDLLRALAAADLAGVALPRTAPIVREVRDRAAARAIEVLADLRLRGYPDADVVELVTALARREPDALGRLPGALEAVREAQGLSRIDAVDSMSAALSSSNNLEAAYSKALGSLSAGRSAPSSASSGRGAKSPPAPRLPARARVRGPIR